MSTKAIADRASVSSEECGSSSQAKRSTSATDFVDVGTAGTDLYFEIVLSVLDHPGLVPKLRNQVLKDLFCLHDRWDMSGIEGEVRRISNVAEPVVETRRNKPPRNGLKAGRTIVKFIKDLLPRIRPTEEVLIARKNVESIGDMFGLSPAEKKLLILIHFSGIYGMIDSLLDDLVSDRNAIPEALTYLTGASKEEASKMALAKAQINQNWLISQDVDCRTFTEIFSIHDGLSDAFRWRETDGGSPVDSLLRAAKPSNLTSEHFPHLKGRDETAAEMLRSTLQTRKKGVNILIYGPPGTGKTELSKLIAASAGGKAYMVGEGDGFGDVDREDRMHDLFLNEALLSVRGEQGSATMIFDEMEDITHFKVGEGSKIVMNRFLDGNRVPIIWIANNLDVIPSYLLRRMMMTIEVAAPPARIQQQMLAGIASDQGIILSPEICAEIQGACDVVPAVAKNAAIAASLVDGSPETMRRIYLDLNTTLLGRKIDVSKSKKQSFYRPELSVTDTDLAKLAERIGKTGNLNFSCLFNGAPGTGKSAAARYVCEQIGVKVIEKRGSDLLGQYVGESEKNIRLAFEEAKDEGAALIFDEIDSMLTDRTTHQRSWETSQVNEFLKGLEDQPTPVFGCTNLLDNLDPAAMRRFLFKVRFDVLDAERGAKCFEHYLGVAAPESIRTVSGFVPSDFTVVKNKASFLDIRDQDELAKLLLQELEVRRGKQSRPMGFLAKL